ncbi:pullulanase [Mycobacterium sp. BMJ-28]
MDYCLADGDGGATMFTAEPAVDADGDGVLDAIGLDLDGDGRFDDALADLDRDGLAERAMHDVGGADAAYFTDDGSGRWLLAADGAAGAGRVRWFGLDGIEQSGGPLVDFDADGQADDRLLDTDGNGLADRVLGGESAYADRDGDGKWDVKLTDSDGDGAADTAGEI